MLPWLFLERCVCQMHTLQQAWGFGTFCQQRHFLFPSKVPTDDALVSPPVFLHHWVISLSTFCLHILQVLMPLWDVQHEAKVICGIKTTWQCFLCVDFFQDFPSLFGSFPPCVSYCNASSYLQISLVYRPSQFSIDSQTREYLQIFQIFQFPPFFLQWERVMSAGDEE